MYQETLGHEAIGKKFGRLTIVQVFKGHISEGRKICKKIICRCDCNNLVTREWRAYLKNNAMSSCGCIKKQMDKTRNIKLFTVHGHAAGKTQSDEYNIWHCMKTRCLNPNAPNYSIYGGRGIKVCDRWISSFQHFLIDMGPRPSKKLSLDRINNDGNYEPSNCRWATALEQVENSRVVNRIKSSCAVCDKDISISKSRLNIKKYCSRMCRDEGLRRKLWQHQKKLPNGKEQNSKIL